VEDGCSGKEWKMGGESDGNLLHGSWEKKERRSRLSTHRVPTIFVISRSSLLDAAHRHVYWFAIRCHLALTTWTHISFPRRLQVPCNGTAGDASCHGDGARSLIPPQMPGRADANVGFDSSRNMD
jgi:hypothetical protein